jgi:hypothetical protein
MAGGTCALCHTLVSLHGALLTPDLVSIITLLPIVTESGKKGLLAEVAELVHLLRGVGLVVRILDEFKVAIRDLPSLARIDQTKILAMLIALMGVKEHEHAEVTEVTLSKSVLVQAMNLGVCQHVPYSLDVNYHHITMGVLPGEVAESLSY